MSERHQGLQGLGRQVERCRLCDSADLEVYLDLGHTPPADQFKRADQLNQPVVHFPLQVLLCGECGLSQLGYVVTPEILYQDEYPYEASTTNAGRRHFREFALSVANRFGFGAGDLAVDVGSNVGVLLAGFREAGLDVMGVDPAQNIAAIAEGRGIPTIADFFDVSAADQILERHGQAAVITATNVFAHVDDLRSFVGAIDKLLRQDGVFVIEAPYFVNLLKKMEYDTIYHEHLSYLSIAPLNRFFAEFGMRIFDVEEMDIHGGSNRMFIDRGGRDMNKDLLERLVERERAEGAYDLERLRLFAADVASHATELLTLLRDLKREGNSIAGVSAPAKGMTLLNYSRIGPELMDFVTEKTDLKVGRFTPGLHIPVKSDEHLIETRPDYALLLAWNFADEIMANLKEYSAKGGRFIVPIPHPRIVEA